MKTRRAVPALLVSAGLVACAAERTSGEAPPASPAQPAPAAYATSPAPQGYPQSAPPPPAADATLPAQPGMPTAPMNRAVALREASSEIESSQRELDVAGGDCRNACRALGSMDRAAGRICGLAQSNDELRRCSDAKTRVYSARDKVRSTCGTCPDVSVDRDAPIPSR